MKVELELPDDREVFVIDNTMSMLYYASPEGHVWKQKNRCIDVCSPEARKKCKGSLCPGICRDSLSSDCALHTTSMWKPFVCCTTPRPTDVKGDCKIEFEQIK